MSSKNSNVLASFMKKQISEKSSKTNFISQSIFGDNNNNQNNKEETKEDSKEDKVSEEEEKEKKEVEQAKLASKTKAAQMDQTEMLKKIVIQNAIKFILIIGAMFGLAYAIIEVGPKMIVSLNGVFLKAFFGFGSVR
ncbi:hypothetical protein LBMAG18_06710 [Alphaproteobacteria bacterium]|nr:hypothetical protein LBMAG18_06710 [Alphaproteobacteria bacterium]